MNNDCLAQMSGVHKRFKKTVALDGLDLEVQRGELLAVLGPNGAGKTTAISLMLGLLRPDQGSVQLFGQSPHAIEARRNIGVMMQEITIVQELLVREHIELVASYYPNALTPQQAMELTQTTALANRRYGQLSGGLKRQVQFTMAICGRPQLLFLDEPTVGLDVEARKTLWATLRQLIRQGTSILLTTHYLEEAESLADRVVVLAKGRTIASGSVNEIRALVVRKHVSCITRLKAEEIRSWPEVETVSQEDQRIVITASNAEAVLAHLIAADPGVQELEVRRAGLAEAFTELTKGAA